MDSHRHLAVSLLVLALVVVPAIALAATNNISTVAGTGTQGFSGDNGPATSAQLSLPISVTLTSDGGYLIVDHGTNRIRRVAADGTITTIAGNGTPGAGGDGGPATSAQFDAPSDVAALPDGSLIVADSNNNKIRKIGLDNKISTVAGTGAAGSGGDEGAATAAQLSFPAGLAVASDGTYLIADNDSNKIRGVTPDGKMHTYAGTGTAGGGGDGGLATTAQLHGPSDVAITPDGGYLITELDGARIRRVDPDGKISTVVGTGTPGYGGDGGPAKAAQVNEPQKIAVASDGSFLFADRNNHRIRRVGTDGRISTVAGTGTAGALGDNGPATSAQLSQPFGVAIDGQGDFLIADTFNDRIRKVDAGDPAPSDPDPDPPPLPPPPPELDTPPTARITASPVPTCTGVTTKFDASGSTPGTSPIVNYRFEYWQRYSSDPRYRSGFGDERTIISDDSDAVVYHAFTWNTFLNVHSWFDSYPARDDVYVDLYVTDANGLTGEASVLIEFLQRTSEDSRAGCPGEAVSADFKPLVIPNKVFNEFVVKTEAVAAPLTCTTRLTGLYLDPQTGDFYQREEGVNCFGSITGFAKTLAASAGNRRLRRARLFEGAVSIPVGERAKVRARLTKRGKRMFKRQGSVRTRILFRMFTPTGEFTKTARTRTLKR